MAIKSLPCIRTETDDDIPKEVMSDIYRLWEDHGYYLRKGSAFFWTYEDELDGGVSEYTTRYPAIFKYLNDQGFVNSDCIIVYDW